MNSPVLITGFHRSGTSAVARAFHAAGLHLGATLLGAEPANPYGHFEDEAAIAAHDAALNAEDLTWKSTETISNRAQAAAKVSDYVASRQAQSSLPWGVKDPRLCLFLPEWLTVNPDASIIFVMRAPGPAIASLHRRHIRRFVDTSGIDPGDLDFWKDPDLGLKLWCHYHEQALPALRSHPSTTFIEYGIEGTDTAIGEAITDLGLTPDPDVVLDIGLGQQATTWFHDPTLLDQAKDLWAAIEDLSQ